MKLPVAPPPYALTLSKILADDGGDERFARLLGARLGPAPNGRYRHWDTFRQSAPLPNESPEEQWVAVKVARSSLYQTLPLLDTAGRPFVFALPNVALELLHKVDRSAAGNIKANDQVANPATRDTYLFKSIVEEAITSSQLEGASTTRRIAKAMIQEGRRPTTRSEQMIANNYEAMRLVLRSIAQPLTPEFVLQLQRVLTEDTLDDADAAGRFRRAEEDIVVEDETGTRLHTPPAATELSDRLQQMCDFANAVDAQEFMPPAVRAILLHFWLAYDHPFVDGNGRTARALFYWSMARQGFWLCEYLSISRILKRARAQYARAFLYTESDDNDTTYFILYQLRVLLRAIDDLRAYLGRKELEIRRAEDTIRHAARVRGDYNHRQLALLNHALKTPHARYTVDSHRRSHGVSYETARADLSDLARRGLLVQSKVGRAFVFVPSRRIAVQLDARN